MRRAALTILLVGMLGHPALAAAQQRWTLVEELRIGTPDEGPDSFNDLRALVVAPDGSILVLDFKTQDIRIFDRDGRHVGNAGRQGAGPGEMRNANGMLLARDGAVWVNDPANQRFSVFAVDGRFLRQHQVPIRSFGFIWEAAADERGRILIPITVQDPEAQTYRRMLERVGMDGRIRDTVPWPTCAPRSRVPQNTFTARGARGSTMRAVPFVPRPAVALGPDGRAWCTPSDEYRVLLLDLETRDTVRLIEANVAGPPVSNAERAQVIEELRAAFSQYEHIDADYSVIPRVKPPIANLYVDDRSRLWVRRTPPDRTVTIFDVWTEQGQHVATVHAPLSFDPWRPLVIRGDYVYGITLDEDDVQYVVRSRIAR